MYRWCVCVFTGACVDSMCVCVCEKETSPLVVTALERELWKEIWVNSQQPPLSILKLCVCVEDNVLAERDWVCVCVCRCGGTGDIRFYTNPLIGVCVCV